MTYTIHTYITFWRVPTTGFVTRHKLLASLQHRALYCNAIQQPGKSVKHKPRFYKANDFENPSFADTGFDKKTGLPDWVTPLMWEPDANTGCWEWREHTLDNGNIRIYVAKEQYEFRYVYLCRVIYENKHGSTPKGMVVTHTCKNKRCINVEHMKLVENGAWLSSSRKLTDQQVSEIKRDPRKNSVVAKVYGISPDYVRKIRRGDYYASIKAEVTPIDRMLHELKEQAKIQQAATVPTHAYKRHHGPATQVYAPFKPIAKRK